MFQENMRCFRKPSYFRKTCVSSGKTYFRKTYVASGKLGVSGKHALLQGILMFQENM